MVWCLKTGRAGTTQVDRVPGFFGHKSHCAGSAIPFMLCCTHDFASDKCEEVGVVLPRALFEGSRGGLAGQRQERTQAGKGPMRASTVWEMGWGEVELGTAHHELE